MESQRFKMHRFTLMLLSIILLLLVLAMIPHFAELKAEVLIGINVTVALLGLIIGFILIRRMNSRLAHLAAVAMAIQQGNYAARSKVKGSDAIGLLAKTVNSMAEKIQSTIEELKLNQHDLEQSRLALAQQHARIEEELRRQAALGDYLLALNSVDIQNLAQMALAYTMEAADIQLGIFYFWDEPSGQLTYLAGRGMDESALATLEAQFSGEGLPSTVLKMGTWVTIKDMDEGALPNIQLGFANAHLQSIAGIPIHFQQRPLGVLILAALHQLDEPTKKLLEGMVRALGNALHNAMTYKTVELQAIHLEVANEKLLEVDQLRCEFVATMSHELRTPLNAIIGFSGLLMKNRNGTLEESEMGYAEKVNRNGKRLLDLINDILDLSKMEAGRMEVIVGPILAHELFREVVDLLQPHAEAKGLALRYEVADHIPVLQTDSEKLRRVLINLVGNALKFTHQGEICIRMNPIDGREVTIEVQDTGIGIAAENFETIFQPFRQVDSGISREYGGSGLGLAITRSLTAMLGGRISVHSAPGEGSIFTVRLPLAHGVESAPDTGLGRGQISSSLEYWKFSASTHERNG